MAPLPLPTLLSQALVAFTIEADNAFEQRMPHVTVVGKYRVPPEGFALWGYAPWLTSMAFWSHFLAHAAPGGTSLGEIGRAGRMVPEALYTLLNGMTRWRYVTVTDGAGGRTRGRPKPDWIVTPTRPGVRAQAEWAPIPAEIEARWASRFGAEAVAGLSGALDALAAPLTTLPSCLPIMRYGMRAELPKDESGAASAGDAALATRLSRALLRFTLDYEAATPLSLARSANVLRVLDETGVAVRDLPRLSGIAKEALSTILFALGRARDVEIVGAGAAKTARLTDRGQAANAAYERGVAETEGAWRERFGDTLQTARRVLEGIVGDGTYAASPLAAGLIPPPGSWRSAVKAPLTLPHHPVIWHRGGFPDGS